MKEGENIMHEHIDAMIREEKREYLRNWRAANKDKVKQHNEAYWRKRAERRLEEQRKQDAEQ